MIVGGAGSDQHLSGKDPYDDPESWKRWISSYTGRGTGEFDAWLAQWKVADDAHRKALAQQEGIAVFNYRNAAPSSSVLPSVQTNDDVAARALQRQILDWGLKDVTIIGHSKGARVLITLMDYYATGKLNRGPVKHAIIIDAPRDERGTEVGGMDWPVNPRQIADRLLAAWWGGVGCVDASKAGISAVDFPGLFPSSVSGATVIQNGTMRVWDQQGAHGLRNDWADTAFLALQVKGEAHYVGCKKCTVYALSTCRGHLPHTSYNYCRKLSAVSNRYGWSFCGRSYNDLEGRQRRQTQF